MTRNGWRRRVVAMNWDGYDMVMLCIYQVTLVMFIGMHIHKAMQFVLLSNLNMLLISVHRIRK